MRTEPATIDLGLYEAAPDCDHGPAGPDRPRPAAPGRGWSAAALVVLLAVTMAAAAPVRPPLVELWTMPDPSEQYGQAVADGQALYVLRTIPAGWTVTAYRLADGTVVWETTEQPYSSGLPANRAGIPWESPSLGVVSAVVLVHHSGVDGWVQTSALDPATGARLWFRDGQVGPELLGGWLMAWHGDYSLPPEAGGRQVSLVDPATGHAVLTVDALGHTVGWESPDGEGYVFTLDGTGQLSRHHAAPAGDVVTVSTPHRQGYLSPLDDAVVVADRSAEESPYLVAYDATTLEPRWQVTDAGLADPCGPVVCVWVVEISQPQPRRLRLDGIDPETGARRWSVPCDPDALDQSLCFVTGQPLGTGDRLWISRWSFGEDNPDGAGRAWVADARTGRAISGPTDWNLEWQAGDGTLVLSQGTNIDLHDGSPPGPVWWARSDPYLSRIQVLGAIDGYWCDPSAYPFLVCQDPAGREQPLTVWRVSR